MAHYLLAVSPLRGHVMPMVNVGVGLQAFGHVISVLTGVEFAATVRAAGLRMLALPDSVRIDAPAAGPALLRSLPGSARRFWLGRAELASVFAQPLAAEAESLRAVLRGEAVDAVIADVTFTGVVPVLLQERPVRRWSCAGWVR